MTNVAKDIIDTINDLLDQLDQAIPPQLDGEVFDLAPEDRSLALQYLVCAQGHVAAAVSALEGAAETLGLELDPISEEDDEKTVDNEDAFWDDEEDEV